MAAPTNYDQTNEWLAEVGRLTQDLINVLKGGIDVGQSGTLGNLALIDSLSAAPIGNLSTLQQALQIASVAGRNTVGPGPEVMLKGAFGSGGPADDPAVFNGTANTYVPICGDWAINGTFGGLPVGAAGNGVLTQYSNPASQSANRIHQVFRRTNDTSLEERYRTWYRYILPGVSPTTWMYNWNTQNTTVDSNGFIKAASPIFRLANSAESATDESHNFTAAGAGAANGEAQGVTATHDAPGVYTVTGSLGFAKAGWTVEVPQDANGNRLCVVDTEQADDGTITVRTFSKRIDPDTGDVVADQPMDIPEGRWIDLRLSMPEPPTNDHPDDAPEPPAPLTPEEQEQQRIEQLGRWRASAAITPRQARLVLAKHGLLTSVADAIAAIEDEQQRQVAEIEWEYATTIERAAPWVNELYGSLGLTPEGVDELFREAALL